MVKEFIGPLEININARILQHGDKVIGRMPHDAILRVDESDAAQPLALRQPKQIGRMIVPQGPDRLVRADAGKQRLPDR